MKRILITGGNGLLGQKLVELMSNSAQYSLLMTSRQESSVFENEAIRYNQLDTTRKNAVQSIVEEFEPNVIVNAAAMTNVDTCEVEREAAWRSNVTGVENLIHAAKLSGARLVHISTDYVFDGKNGPYSELDRPNPISYYGRTKLASENIVLTSGVAATVIRTMVLYGIGHKIKQNFALWLLKNLSEGKPVRVVDDQIGTPTLAEDLAYGIFKIIELDRKGLYHIAGPDLLSRYDFAVTLARIFDLNKKHITPVRTSTMKQPAQRPLKSGLITLKAQTDLGLALSGVEHGLTMFKNQINADREQFLKSIPF